MGMNDQEGDAVQNWSPKCGINQTFSDVITFSFFECPLTLEASCVCILDCWVQVY